MPTRTSARKIRPRKPLRTGLLLSLVVLLLTSSGCVSRGEYPSRPITLVCPWGAGGGTDRVSRQMAAHLESELGVPVNVINATGGKGVTGHSRGMEARPDGYTLAMITLELNMMHWSGLTSLTYDDCELLYSVNEDYAALLVRTDAPWSSLSELEADIKSRPGELKASGTASGGAWHLAVAGWLLAREMDVEDVVWVSSTGAGPSLQELISGGLDMVCCSLPEAGTLLAGGQVRALGLMAPTRSSDYPDVPTFQEQGSDWSLGGWRGLAVAKGTPPQRVEKLAAAIGRVVRGQTEVGGQTFPEFMKSQRFDNTFRDPQGFREFLKENDAKFGKLLTSEAMRSVGQDPFPPLLFPGLIGGLILISLSGLAIGRGRSTTSVDAATVATTSGAAGAASGVAGWQRSGMIRFAAVMVAAVSFVLLADELGFLLTVTPLLFGLLWLLGTRWWFSLLLSVAVSTSIYYLFSLVLRVPLPPGWLG